VTLRHLQGLGAHLPLGSPESILITGRSKYTNSLVRDNKTINLSSQFYSRPWEEAQGLDRAQSTTYEFALRLHGKCSICGGIHRHVVNWAATLDKQVRHSKPGQRQVPRVIALAGSIAEQEPRHLLNETLKILHTHHRLLLCEYEVAFLISRPRGPFPGRTSLRMLNH
jgi:hypothetical protein